MDAPLEVLSRAAANREFSARPERAKSTVSVEWLYQPFFLPTGHLALRVGQRVFSFSPKGWELWNKPGHDAQAFLFDNTFDQNQVATYRRLGHEVFDLTIGLPMQLPRDLASKMLRSLRKAARSGVPFSLASNNCTTQLFDALPSARPSALGAIAPALALRSLLHDPPFPIGQPRAYPVAGNTPPVAPARVELPAHLAASHTPARELLRIVKNSPLALRTRWIRRFLAQELGRMVTLPLHHLQARLSARRSK